jgi:chromosome segregation protein
MRLERLKISGFKSFSDRSELVFDTGVTAIVGPNGCGKSNLADAITWVLGEQSAKSLRGDRMDDVIFGGSDARRPGSTAEVSLRLRDLPGVPKSALSDEASSQPSDDLLAEPLNGNGNGHALGSIQSNQLTRDVDVTRRLYRSGESEYLIDGKVCRLRDIHELLMDTGLGAKAYAIIEQGKIGMILNSRPIDRRQLIEEAAGVTRYKSRRRAAALKLEAAQQNLTRIDDIVFEVEKQRSALKRQAARARRYRRLRDGLRWWEKVLFARRHRELTESIATTQAQVVEARERVTVSAGHLAEIEATLSRLRIEQVEADEQATLVRENAHTYELEINRRQQQVEFSRHQIETLESRATDINNGILVLESRREPLRVSIESSKSATEEAERTRNKTEEAVFKVREAIASITSRHSTQEAKLSTARVEHEQCMKKMRASDQEVTGLEARLLSLEELEVSRVGFGDAARMLLVQGDVDIGQQGAIADYLETDGQYERAVEACLSEFLQYVIVEKHDQAITGLALAREKNSGRCGFVVIDAKAKNDFQIRQSRQVPGILPIADVLKISGPHASILKEVMPEAYIAESFEQAMEVSSQINALVATLDGDVFRGTRLLTGGVKAESRGILQTKREIKEIRVSVKVAREVLVKLITGTQSLEEIINKINISISDLVVEQHALEKEAAVLETKLSGLLERASGLSTEADRLQEGSRELEARLTAHKEELGQTELKNKQLLQSIADDEQQLDKAVIELEASQEILRTADEGTLLLRAKVEAQDTAIRAARRDLDGLRTEVSDLEILRTKRSADLDHLVQACIDSVQLTLDKVIVEVEKIEEMGRVAPEGIIVIPEGHDSEVDENEDEPSGEVEQLSSASIGVEEAIAALRRKIERLGPVNMMAVEQFDELETRHEFLTTQRQDLIDSIAQTTEAIKRIDETTTARFLEAFSAIQSNFQGTFSTLFGGGRAGLALLDENDPLESGIDIVASPPGKRLQSVQLLSGGEKALTAIALMFAIFQYKPSPFCLLDEIDAPLDDANVSRFVEMLQSMLDRTQFILITHNRRTMEIANRLYGVTMEEPGVSKLISVELN